MTQSSWPYARALMATSAVFMLALGGGATFAPAEYLAHVGASTVRGAQLAVQAAGALYLGFAALNWMARGVLIGGIYARPLALGNFVHFVVLSFALVRVATASPAPVLIGLATVYVLFAVWFGVVQFTAPKLSGG